MRAMIKLKSLTAPLLSVHRRQAVHHIISTLCWCTSLITPRWMLHLSFLLLTSWLKMCKGLFVGLLFLSLCLSFQLSSTHLIYNAPPSINKWTGSMWWISLLTLYQLQVNNYYSGFIVGESIPGCCHLAKGKRLAWKLLFGIWSNVHVRCQWIANLVRDRSFPGVDDSGVL